MHCPFCQHTDTRVIDSRVSEDGATIRRRRECEACGERFSTLENIEIKLPTVIKSDGRRDSFDARKLRLGFDRALQKRPVSEEQIEAAVRAVVRTALTLGAEVYAIFEGYQGMIDGGDGIRRFGWEDVGSILHKGGTVIGTLREGRGIHVKVQGE